MKKPLLEIILFFCFTAFILLMGYLSFGIWTTLIFSSGFLGGYLIWFFVPARRIEWSKIKLEYWLTLVCFILLHRVEENIFRFQDNLSEITGTPVPELTSLSLISLVLASVGGWLLIPFLIKRQHEFGYYLAWSFFAAMGITELAHFIFPLFVSGSYGYFPGMASVVLLAPLAWLGMYKLYRNGKAF